MARKGKRKPKKAENEDEPDLVNSIGILSQLEDEASEDPVSDALLRLMRKERSLMREKVDEGETNRYFEKIIRELDEE